MEAEEIKSSRGKSVLLLVSSLAFLSISVAMPSETAVESFNSWFAVAFSGLCSVVFAFLLIRPHRLLLAPSGFTVTGGFVRSPKQVLWHDVNPFFVFRLGRAGKVIGYNFAPGSKDTTLIRMNRFVGAEGALPQGWPGSPDRMVERINAYRALALAQDTNFESGAL
ncbi:hypothetical protein WEU32_04430 [Brevundimonas sp. BH3]|uniref:hypothetical protein n=1 Tax=Brevundimonas sp. BH3 TaxID=3133089 RepID=UPI00324423AE